MKYSLKPTSGGQFSLPLELIDRLPDAGETELKILLIIYALAAEKGADELEDSRLRECAAEAGLDEKETESAIGFWRGAGFLTGKKRKTAKAENSSDEKPISPKKPDEQSEKTENKQVLFDPGKKPAYSGGELADAVSGKPDFKALVDYTQQRLGKMINQSELGILYSLYDYLKMPVEVIMLAIEHCVSENKSSIRYVEKLLISFADDGIDSYEGAEAYINRRRKYKSFEGRIRSLCGLGERALTKSEKAIVSALSESETPEELITLAYEKTVAATGKASLAYMNKILSDWSEKGIKTAAEAQSEPRAAGKDDTSVSYDLGNFFEAAVSRGRSNQDDKDKRDES